MSFVVFVQWVWRDGVMTAAKTNSKNVCMYV